MDDARKFIVGVFLPCYLLTQLLTPDTAQAAALSFASPRTEQVFQTWNLSPELGTIQERIVVPQSRGVMVHIQDAHAVLSAQESIQEILDRLQKDFGVQKIFLEGGAGKLDPELHHFFPGGRKLTDSEIKTWMEEGDLTGAESFLMRAQGVEGQGLENTQDYFGNREAYRRTVEKQVDGKEFLEPFYKHWQSAAENKLKPGLKKYLEQYAQAQSDVVHISDWLRALYNYSKTEEHRDLADVHEQIEFPMLTRYYLVQRAEKEWNLPQLEKEKQAFFAKIRTPGADHGQHRELGRSSATQRGELLAPILKAISELLTPPTSEVGSNGQPPRLGRLSNPRALFEQLAQFLPDDFSISDLPELKQFIQVLILSSEIDAQMLAQEAGKRHAQVVEAAAQDSTVQEVVAMLDKYVLMKKLFALELSRDDYFKTLKTIRAPSSLAAELKSQITGSQAANASHVFKPADDLYRTALLFYQGALSREQDFTKTMELFLNHRGQSPLRKDSPRHESHLPAAEGITNHKSHDNHIVVVVTGGFHSAGIREAVLKNGYSYVEIMPHVSEIRDEDHAHYLRALLGTTSTPSADQGQHRELGRSAGTGSVPSKAQGLTPVVPPFSQITAALLESAAMWQPRTQQRPLTPGSEARSLRIDASLPPIGDRANLPSSALPFKRSEFRNSDWFMKPQMYVAISDFIASHRNHDSIERGIGTFKDWADDAIEKLIANGVRVNHLIPFHDRLDESPYAPIDAHSVDPLLIDWTQVSEINAAEYQEWLVSKSLKNEEVDYKELRSRLEKLWKMAFNRFSAGDLVAQSGRGEAYKAFKAKNLFWLKNYAEYRALHEILNKPSLETQFTGTAPDKIETTVKEEWTADEIKKAKERDGFDSIAEKYMYLQWLGHKQFEEALSRVAQAGGKILFDMPMFRGKASVDVFSHPEYFVDPQHRSPGISAPKFDNYFAVWNDLAQWDWEALARDNYRVFVEPYEYWLSFAGGAMAGARIDAFAFMYHFSDGGPDFPLIGGHEPGKELAGRLAFLFNVNQALGFAEAMGGRDVEAHELGMAALFHEWRPAETHDDPKRRGPGKFWATWANVAAHVAWLKTQPKDDKPKATFVATTIGALTGDSTPFKKESLGQSFWRYRLPPPDQKDQRRKKPHNLMPLIKFYMALNEGQVDVAHFKIWEHQDILALALEAAASAFVTEKEDLTLALLGAHEEEKWFLEEWGRKIFISLIGILLANDRQVEAREIFKKFEGLLRNGLIPTRLPAVQKKDQLAEEPQYDSADASLWFIRALAITDSQHSISPSFVRQTMSAVTSTVEHYMAGTFYEKDGARQPIKMDTDGLLITPDGGTWMNARPAGENYVTPRGGKTVEINALWYAALRFMEKHAGEESEKYKALADQVRESFRATFNNPAWIDHASKNISPLFDSIKGDEKSGAIRPNMVIAAAVGGDLLTDDMKKAVYETTREHLFTPMGLRTLAPENPDYQPYFPRGQNQAARDHAYHQGSVFPWLMGFYIDLMADVMKMENKEAEIPQAVRELTEPLLRYLLFGQKEANGEKNAIHSLPELFDGLMPGDTHHKPGNLLSYASSVGEIMRALTQYQVLSPPTRSEHRATHGSPVSGPGASQRSEMRNPNLSRLRQLVGRLLEMERDDLSETDEYREEWVLPAIFIWGLLLVGVATKLAYVVLASFTMQAVHFGDWLFSFFSATHLNEFSIFYTGIAAFTIAASIVVSTPMAEEKIRSFITLGASLFYISKFFADRKNGLWPYPWHSYFQYLNARKAGRLEETELNGAPAFRFQVSASVESVSLSEIIRVALHHGLNRSDLMRLTHKNPIRVIIKRNKKDTSSGFVKLKSGRFLDNVGGLDLRQRVLASDEVFVTIPAIHGTPLPVNTDFHSGDTYLPRSAIRYEEETTVNGRSELRVTHESPSSGPEAGPARSEMREVVVEGDWVNEAQALAAISAAILSPQKAEQEDEIHLVVKAQSAEAAAALKDLGFSFNDAPDARTELSASLAAKRGVTNIEFKVGLNEIHVVMGPVKWIVKPRTSWSMRGKSRNLTVDELKETLRREHTDIHWVRKYSRPTEGTLQDDEAMRVLLARLPTQFTGKIISEKAKAEKSRRVKQRALRPELNLEKLTKEISGQQKALAFLATMFKDVRDKLSEWAEIDARTQRLQQQDELFNKAERFLDDVATLPEDKKILKEDLIPIKLYVFRMKLFRKQQAHSIQARRAKDKAIKDEAAATAKLSEQKQLQETAATLVEQWEKFKTSRDPDLAAAMVSAEAAAADFFKPERGKADLLESAVEKNFAPIDSAIAQLRSWATTSALISRAALTDLMQSVTELLEKLGDQLCEWDDISLEGAQPSRSNEPVSHRLAVRYAHFWDFDLAVQSGLARLQPEATGAKTGAAAEAEKRFSYQFFKPDKSELSDASRALILQNFEAIRAQLETIVQAYSEGVAEGTPKYLFSRNSIARLYQEAVYLLSDENLLPAVDLPVDQLGDFFVNVMHFLNMRVAIDWDAHLVDLTSSRPVYSDKIGTVVAGLQTIADEIGFSRKDFTVDQIFFPPGTERTPFRAQIAADSTLANVSGALGHADMALVVTSNDAAAIVRAVMNDIKTQKAGLVLVSRRPFTVEEFGRFDLSDNSLAVNTGFDYFVARKKGVAGDSLRDAIRASVRRVVDGSNLGTGTTSIQVLRSQRKKFLNRADLAMYLFVEQETGAHSQHLLEQPNLDNAAEMARIKNLTRFVELKAPVQNREALIVSSDPARIFEAIVADLSVKGFRSAIWGNKILAKGSYGAQSVTTGYSAMGAHSVWVFVGEGSPEFTESAFLESQRRLRESTDTFQASVALSGASLGRLQLIRETFGEPGQEVPFYICVQLQPGEDPIEFARSEMRDIKTPENNRSQRSEAREILEADPGIFAENDDDTKRYQFYSAMRQTFELIQKFKQQKRPAHAVEVLKKWFQDENLKTISNELMGTLERERVRAGFALAAKMMSVLDAGSTSTDWIAGLRSKVDTTLSSGRWNSDLENLIERIEAEITQREIAANQIDEYKKLCQKNDLPAMRAFLIDRLRDFAFGWRQPTLGTWFGSLPSGGGGQPVLSLADVWIKQQLGYENDYENGWEVAELLQSQGVSKVEKVAATGNGNPPALKIYFNKPLKIRGSSPTQSFLYFFVAKRPLQEIQGEAWPEYSQSFEADDAVFDALSWDSKKDSLDSILSKYRDLLLLLYDPKNEQYPHVNRLLVLAESTVPAKAENQRAYIQGVATSRPQANEYLEEAFKFLTAAIAENQRRREVPAPAIAAVEKRIAALDSSISALRAINLFAVDEQMLANPSEDVPVDKEIWDKQTNDFKRAWLIASGVRKKAVNEFVPVRREIEKEELPSGSIAVVSREDMDFVLSFMEKTHPDLLEKAKQRMTETMQNREVPRETMDAIIANRDVVNIFTPVLLGFIGLQLNDYLLTELPFDWKAEGMPPAWANDENLHQTIRHRRLIAPLRSAVIQFLTRKGQAGSAAQLYSNSEEAIKSISETDSRAFLKDFLNRTLAYDSIKAAMGTLFDEKILTSLVSEINSRKPMSSGQHLNIINMAFNLAGYFEGLLDEDHFEPSLPKVLEAGHFSEEMKKKLLILTLGWGEEFGSRAFAFESVGPAAQVHPVSGRLTTELGKPRDKIYIEPRQFLERFGFQSRALGTRAIYTALRSSRISSVEKIAAVGTNAPALRIRFGAMSAKGEITEKTVYAFVLKRAAQPATPWELEDEESVNQMLFSDTDTTEISSRPYTLFMHAVMERRLVWCMGYELRAENAEKFVNELLPASAPPALRNYVLKIMRWQSEEAASSATDAGVNESEFTAEEIAHEKELIARNEALNLRMRKWLNPTYHELNNLPEGFRASWVHRFQRTKEVLSPFSREQIEFAQMLLQCFFAEGETLQASEKGKLALASDAAAEAYLGIIADYFQSPAFDRVVAMYQKLKDQDPGAAQRMSFEWARDFVFRNFVAVKAGGAKAINLKQWRALLLRARTLNLIDQTILASVSVLEPIAGSTAREFVHALVPTSRPRSSVAQTATNIPTINTKNIQTQWEILGFKLNEIQTTDDAYWRENGFVLVVPTAQAVLVELERLEKLGADKSLAQLEAGYAELFKLHLSGDRIRGGLPALLNETVGTDPENEFQSWKTAVETKLQSFRPVPKQPAPPAAPVVAPATKPTVPTAAPVVSPAVVPAEETDALENGYGSDPTFFNTTLAKVRRLDPQLNWERLKRSGLSAHAKLVLEVEKEICEWERKANPETKAALNQEEKAIREKIVAKHDKKQLNNASKMDLLAQLGKIKTRKADAVQQAETAAARQRQEAGERRALVRQIVSDALAALMKLDISREIPVSAQADFDKTVDEAGENFTTTEKADLKKRATEVLKAKNALVLVRADVVKIAERSTTDEISIGVVAGLEQPLRLRISNIKTACPLQKQNGDRAFLDADAKAINEFFAEVVKLLGTKRVLLDKVAKFVSTTGAEPAPADYEPKADWKVAEVLRVWSEFVELQKKQIEDRKTLLAAKAEAELINQALGSWQEKTATELVGVDLASEKEKLQARIDRLPDDAELSEKTQLQTNLEEIFTQLENRIKLAQALKTAGVAVDSKMEELRRLAMTADTVDADLDAFAVAVDEIINAHHIPAENVTASEWKKEIAQLIQTKTQDRDKLFQAREDAKKTPAKIVGIQTEILHLSVRIGSATQEELAVLQQSLNEKFTALRALGLLGVAAADGLEPTINGAIGARQNVLSAPPVSVSTPAPLPLLTAPVQETAGPAAAPLIAPPPAAPVPVVDPKLVVIEKLLKLNESTSGGIKVSGRLDSILLQNGKKESNRNGVLERVQPILTEADSLFRDGRTNEQILAAAKDSKSLTGFKDTEAVAREIWLIFFVAVYGKYDLVAERKAKREATQAAAEAARLRLPEATTGGSDGDTPISPLTEKKLGLEALFLKDREKVVFEVGKTSAIIRFKMPGRAADVAKKRISARMELSPQTTVFSESEWQELGQKQNLNSASIRARAAAQKISVAGEQPDPLREEIFSGDAQRFYFVDAKSGAMAGVEVFKVTMTADQIEIGLQRFDPNEGIIQKWKSPVTLSLGESVSVQGTTRVAFAFLDIGKVDKIVIAPKGMDVSEPDYNLYFKDPFGVGSTREIPDFSNPFLSHKITLISIDKENQTAELRIEPTGAAYFFQLAEALILKGQPIPREILDPIEKSLKNVRSQFKDKQGPGAQKHPVLAASEKLFLSYQWLLFWNQYLQKETMEPHVFWGEHAQAALHFFEEEDIRRKFAVQFGPEGDSGVAAKAVAQSQKFVFVPAIKDMLGLPPVYEVASRRSEFRTAIDDVLLATREFAGGIFSLNMTLELRENVALADGYFAKVVSIEQINQDRTRARGILGIKVVQPSDAFVLGADLALNHELLAAIPKLFPGTAFAVVVADDKTRQRLQEWINTEGLGESIFVHKTISSARSGLRLRFPKAMIAALALAASAEASSFRDEQLPVITFTLGQLKRMMNFAEQAGLLLGSFHSFASAA